MRVTVVIPLYNKAPYVRRALDSIAAQTFGDFEIIIIDDGSTDGGGEIASQYPDARVRVLRQENLGPGAARNRGIAEARGEFIAFLDADDEWSPEYLAHAMACFERFGAGVATVTSGYLEYPSGISRASLWRARGIREGVHRVTPRTPVALLANMLAYMSPCSTLVRAATIRKWGGFFDRDRCVYGEDAFIWIKVLLNESVAFHTRPLACFHTEASGLSNNLTAARPVDPFFAYPEEIETICPPPLRGLLARSLAHRALKTACMFGYWGQWRRADEIRRRFTCPGAWRLAYYFPALLASTRAGAWAGTVWRALIR